MDFIRQDELNLFTPFSSFVLVEYEFQIAVYIYSFCVCGIKSAANLYGVTALLNKY